MFTCILAAAVVVVPLLAVGVVLAAGRPSQRPARGCDCGRRGCQYPGRPVRGRAAA